MRSLSVVTLFAAFGLVAAAPAARAQTPAAKKQQPPPVGPERPFTFPAHTATKLENGMTVFVVEDHRQPVVSATLMLPAAGASANAAKSAGLAAMTAALLRQGTATRSAQQIAESIDKVGGSLSAGAGADTTQASVTVLTSSLDTGFDLLADIVQRPAFAPEEIERWRRQTLSSLQVAYRDPEYLRNVAGQYVGYGEHPYAYPTDGFPQTVRGLSRDAVAAFHKERYTPAGAYLAIAGDITTEAATALARKHFGGWKAAGTPKAAAPTPAKGQRRIVVIDQPDAVQTQFGMIGAGVPRNHPDWLALSVANQILGGSFNSRLNLRLRAKEGLTYGARSAIDSNRLAGLWTTTSFTRTEESANAMKVMLDVIREFRKNPATAAELSEATSYLSGVFALQSETADAVAGRVLTLALHGLPADYWQTYRDRVRKISAADVAAAVERHVDPERLSIVAVGNASGFAKALEPLGMLTIVPAAKLDLTEPGLVAKEEAAAGPGAAARGLALIKMAAEAAGGAAKLADVKDVIATGELTLFTPGGEMQGKSRSMILHPDRSRGVVTLPVGDIVQTYDSGRGTMAMPGQGSTEVPAAITVEMRRAILLNGGIGVVREALSGSAQVAALEPKPVEGVTLDRVSWKKGELEMVLGLDPKSHHIVHVSYRAVTPQGTADTELHLSGHKPAAGGIVVPMRVTTFQNGQKAVDVVIAEWQFNTGLTPESFKK
jgi:predicted Zn-dependent peptidase